MHDASKMVLCRACWRTKIVTSREFVSIADHEQIVLTIGSYTYSCSCLAAPPCSLVLRLDTLFLKVVKVVIVVAAGHWVREFDLRLGLCRSGT